MDREAKLMDARERTWTIIVSKTGAKLFERRGGRGEIQLLSEIVHREGRMRDRELESDRPGRVRLSSGNYRSSYGHEAAAKSHSLRKFIQLLSEEIEKGAYSGKFERLVIVADAPLLGEIRGQLGIHSRAKLSKEVVKDLNSFPLAEVKEKISELLQLS